MVAGAEIQSARDGRPERSGLSRASIIKSVAKHHYVPAFYLKKFADPNTPAGQEPYVWVAPKAGGDWQRRAPKNTGYKTDLYTVTMKGGVKSDVLETAFSAIESRMATIYRDKLDRLELPTADEERAFMAEFIALFVVRSPFMRASLTRTAEQMGEMHRHIMAAHPESFKDDMNRLAADNGEAASKLTTEDIVRALRGETVKWSVNPELITEISLSQVDYITKIIYRMNWRLLVAPFGEHFVTADSPAYWQDLTPRPWFYGGHGLAMTNVEVVLPLSSKVCFLGRWGRSTGVMPVKAAHVRELVNRTIQWSIQEVFSPLQRVSMADWESQPLYPFAPEGDTAGGVSGNGQNTMVDRAAVAKKV